jgi:hypothetical protein
MRGKEIEKILKIFQERFKIENKNKDKKLELKIKHRLIHFLSCFFS